MHILRVANFVSPTSGGIKTALRHWGEVYRERGHQVSLIVPQPGPALAEESQGMVYRVPATPITGTGYSLIWSRAGMSRLMDTIAPDAIEVSDRATTRWMGRWARRRGIGSVMISHETMQGIMVRRTPVPDPLAVAIAGFINDRSSLDYDAIVCPSRFAAEEFHTRGLPAEVVPLGVDLEVFRPTRDLTAYRAPGREEKIRLVHCSRLSPEKNPRLSIATVREMVRRGLDVELTVLGEGPMRETLIEEAKDLPVVFHAYVTSRQDLARLMNLADVALSPGPLETFGLAALELLACGVPTVCCDEGALHEVVGTGGRVTASAPAAFADAVLELLERPGARQRAREQAGQYNWAASADRMLSVHERLLRR